MQNFRVTGKCQGSRVNSRFLNNNIIRAHNEILGLTILMPQTRDNACPKTVPQHDLAILRLRQKNALAVAKNTLAMAKNTLAIADDTESHVHILF